MPEVVGEEIGLQALLVLVDQGEAVQAASLEQVLPELQILVVAVAVAGDLLDLSQVAQAALV